MGLLYEIADGFDAALENDARERPCRLFVGDLTHSSCRNIDYRIAMQGDITDIFVGHSNQEWSEMLIGEGAFIQCIEQFFSSHHNTSF